MVGANYMGGRRSAAKARTRDKSGKAQKEFFGRRRLNLLSKGLGIQPHLMTREEVITTGTLVARSSISLSHAKKAELVPGSDANISESINSESSTSRTRKRSSISSFTVSSSSPCSKGSTKTKSSFKLTKSKLLQELDILEPFSSNVAISCILAMPDLAGLAGLSSSSSSGERSRLKPLSPSPIASGDEFHISGGEDEIVDYLSGSGSEYQAFSASLPHSGEQCLGMSSMLGPEQLSDLTTFIQPTSPQAFGSRHDMIFPDEQFDNHADVDMPGSTDWSFNDLSSPSPSLVLGSTHQDTDGGQSFETGKPNGKLLLANDDKALSGQGSQHRSWPYARKGRFTDAEPAVEQERTNLLDYPDPWGQIGVILGLQEDCLLKDNQTWWPTQEESDSQELLAAFETDLPPSDIPLDDSLDDTLFAPSSLPIAESSEATKVSSIPSISDHACVFEEVNDPDHWDDWCFRNLSDEILLFLDPVAGTDMDTINSTAPQTTNAVFCVRTSGDNDSGVPEEHPAHFPGDDAINSTPVPLAVGHDDETSIQSHTLSTPATVPQNDGRTEKQQSPAGIPWSSGGVSLQERNLSHDTPKGGGHSIAEAVSQKGSVLTVPELLDCDGIYQGPCLLSDDSECLELEE